MINEQEEYEYKLRVKATERYASSTLHINTRRRRGYKRQITQSCMTSTPAIIAEQQHHIQKQEHNGSIIYEDITVKQQPIVEDVVELIGGCDTEYLTQHINPCDDIDGIHYTIITSDEIGNNHQLHHALSLAQQSVENDIDYIGYAGSSTTIDGQANIRLVPISSNWSKWTEYFIRLHILLYCIFAPIQSLLQFSQLLFTLLMFTSSKKHNTVLIQNTPSISEVIAIRLYVFLMRVFTMGHKEFSIGINSEIQ
jgi:hypothetical protein